MKEGQKCRMLRIIWGVYGILVYQKNNYRCVGDFDILILNQRQGNGIVSLALIPVLTDLFFLIFILENLFNYGKKALNYFFNTSKDLNLFVFLI